MKIHTSEVLMQRGIYVILLKITFLYIKRSGGWKLGGKPVSLVHIKILLGRVQTASMPL